MHSNKRNYVSVDVFGLVREELVQSSLYHLRDSGDPVELCRGALHAVPVPPLVGDSTQNRSVRHVVSPRSLFAVLYVTMETGPFR
ncbi:hypothetical protein EYF80_057831 [Liparis tanakae]|uniref:Uncharacterized protein n=1 Tax=Liparis tanakae TaxID=230148 RepID=A0A4Z2ETP6_9TELE|nr:hypothetical protein EYF80_057831 [Liparis tanakae]